jgi:catechol 2,3-dioxygenase-like lactoylglutathione lyase family enzyme
MYQKNITTLLKNIVIFSKDLEKTAGFYSDALGLKIVN